eukprot:4163043-Prymnesium_polylepis.1
MPTAPGGRGGGRAADCRYGRDPPPQGAGRNLRGLGPDPLCHTGTSTQVSPQIGAPTNKSVSSGPA